MFDGECGMSLEPMRWIWASSRGEGGNLMVFFELRWEAGVSSLVMMGMFFKHSCFLINVRTPI